MKVKSLVEKFLNLPKEIQVNLMRDGFNQNLSLEDALQCKRRVIFFSYYPEVFTSGEEDSHPELNIEIE